MFRTVQDRSVRSPSDDAFTSAPTKNFVMEEEPEVRLESLKTVLEQAKSTLENFGERFPKYSTAVAAGLNGIVGVTGVLNAGVTGVVNAGVTGVVNAGVAGAAAGIVGASASGLTTFSQRASQESPEHTGQQQNTFTPTPRMGG